MVKNKNSATERAEQGITLIAVGTVIAIFGFALCSLTSANKRRKI